MNPFRYVDGPSSPLFEPWPLRPRTPAESGDGVTALTPEHRELLRVAPQGDCVCRGLAFAIGEPTVVRERAAVLAGPPRRAEWLVFQHTLPPLPRTPGAEGQPAFGQTVAEIDLLYASGRTLRLPIRFKHEISRALLSFGDTPTHAEPAMKPTPTPRRRGDRVDPRDWGYSLTGAQWQTDRAAARAAGLDPMHAEWFNWLWPWRNPHPDEAVIGLRLSPVSGTTLLFGVSAGNARGNPLRWGARRRLQVQVPPGTPPGSLFTRCDHVDLAAKPAVDGIDVDLGMVLDVTPALQLGDAAAWALAQAYETPPHSPTTMLIELVAHPQARLIIGERVLPVDALEGPEVVPLPAAGRPVRLRVIDAASGQALAARVHVHDEHGACHAPYGWQAQPDTGWFQITGAQGAHHAGRLPFAHIRGEATWRLPPGRVFIEVSKGFEWQPLRTVVEVDAHCSEIRLPLTLDDRWRRRGWYSSDTHVHFVSPSLGLLEGAAEDVHLVHLLAAQWGELMTNVGDFDGQTLARYEGKGHDGQNYLWVGTENRQPRLGHINLLAYRGEMIAPLSSDGGDEARIGQPLEVSLLEWAERCRAQGGSVVMPHWPNPPLENAAVVTAGLADAVEMMVADEDRALDPYALADWYRFLNCGLSVPIAGGTDKMSADMIIGHVRTYAQLPAGAPFSLPAWQDALRAGRTFVSTGPLLELAVDGRPMGARLGLPAGGGSVDVTWQVASLLVPTTAVELVRNGEVLESLTIDRRGGSGSWRVPMPHSGWLALRVRALGPTGKVALMAHSSAVTVEVAGSAFRAGADAASILRQMECAIGYLESGPDGADAATVERIRARLRAVHREFHDRMHAQGLFHDHHHDPHAPHRH